jgi:hypothetical protein
VERHRRPGFSGFQWLAAYPLGVREAPALVQLAVHGRLWLLPLWSRARVPAMSCCRRVLAGNGASLLLIAAGASGSRHAGHRARDRHQRLDMAAAGAFFGRCPAGSRGWATAH